MKKVFLSLAILLIVIIAPACAYLSPSNVTVNDGSNPTQGTAAATIDGNTGTNCQLGAEAGSLRFNMPSGTTTYVTSVDLYNGDTVTPRQYNFCEVATDISSKCTNGAWVATVPKLTWTTFTFPYPLQLTNGYLRIRGSSAAWFNLNEIRITGYNATYSDIETSNISFTGSPSYGFNPLLVNFTASTGKTYYRWNFGDGTIVNGTSSSVLHTYTMNGKFTVKLEAYSGVYGWANYTRSEYITVTDPSGVVINVDIKDSISGALIQDTSVGIQNRSTGVWRNSTAPTGLIYYDSTDPNFLYPLSVNQSITIAASKTGYSPAVSTFSIPYDNYRAYLYLVPSSVVNATGSGTVVATVVRNSNGLPVPGTSVVLDTGQMGMTNSAGAVTLQNVSAGTRYATVTNPGYQTTKQSFTLAAGETKMVLIQILLDGETPVATYAPPGGSADPLVDTDGDGVGDTPSSLVGNYTPGQLNQKGSSGLMQLMGALMSIAGLVVLGLLFKFGKSVLWD
jgi:hypothetical protein